jgi:hypothetical protein
MISCNVRFRAAIFNCCDGLVELGRIILLSHGIVMTGTSQVQLAAAVSLPCGDAA